MVTPKKVPKPAMVHQKSGPPPRLKNIEERTVEPYGDGKKKLRITKPIPLVSPRKRKKITIAPRIKEDTARDLEIQDRKIAPAHIHSDTRNKIESEPKIVGKSIPPRRKLIAMNGARAANS